MAKLPRVFQKIFGLNAVGSSVGVFGSYAATTPTLATDPTTAQSLGAWLNGWLGAVVGQNSPAIEDMNAPFYVLSYQLAYLMQQGMPEWNALTTYFQNSFVGQGGVIYLSLQDTNLNHAVTDSAWWIPLSGGVTIDLDPSTQSPYTLTAGDNGKTFIIKSNNAAMTFNLPAPSTKLSFSIKDGDGNLLTNNCTIMRNASELIENLASSYICEAPYGAWTIKTDGTNWFLS